MLALEFLVDVSKFGFGIYVARRCLFAPDLFADRNKVVIFFLELNVWIVITQRVDPLVAASEAHFVLVLEG